MTRRFMFLILLGCGARVVELDFSGSPSEGEVEGVCTFDEDCPAGTVCAGGVCAKQADPDGGDPCGPPDIEVTPAAIDFGAPPIGTEIVREVTIANVGCEPLTIEAIVLIEDSSDTVEFTLDDDDDVPIVIAGGAAWSFGVTYRPVGRDRDTGRVIIIASNDPDEPTVEIDLTTRGSDCASSLDGLGEACKAGGAKACDALQTCILASQAFYVTLSWDVPVDLDLHLVRCQGEDSRWAQAPDGIYWNRPTADWCAPREYTDEVCSINSDCTDEDPDTEFKWCTPDPSSGENRCTDAVDDPFLLIDSDAPGQPETIVAELPCAGSYAVGVHYFGPIDGDTVTATVSVYVLGELVAEAPLVLEMQPKDFWTVGPVLIREGLSGAIFEAEVLAEGVNPTPDTPLSSLPSPCVSSCGDGTCEFAECCSCFADCDGSPAAVAVCEGPPALDCYWCLDQETCVP